jgi:hypothetical protein
MRTQVIAQRLLSFRSAWLISIRNAHEHKLPVCSSRERGNLDNGPEGYNGLSRRRGYRFVYSGRTTFFPVPVLQTSISSIAGRTATAGRMVTFLPFLNKLEKQQSGPQARGASRQRFTRLCSYPAIRPQRQSESAIFVKSHTK